MATQPLSLSINRDRFLEGLRAYGKRPRVLCSQCVIGQHQSCTGCRCKWCDGQLERVPAVS
jgi:hypothetical protein